MIVKRNALVLNSSPDGGLDNYPMLVHSTSGMWNINMVQSNAVTPNKEINSK